MLLAGLLVVLTGGGFLASRLVSQPSPPAAPDPAFMPIEYRPGCNFPEGFPLHGTVRLLSSPVVEAGQRARIRVEYTVGDMPIETGMTIEVWKHFTSDVEEFQVTDPNAPAYFGVEFTNPAVKAKTRKFTNWVQRNTPSVFPYRKTAAVTIEQGRLTSGDKVLFDLGGPKGVRMQRYEEHLFNFRIVITRNNKVLGYAGDAAMKVTGGPLRKLRVKAPAIVAVGDKFPVEIVPLDEWSSLAKNHEGLSFRVTSGNVSAGTFHYDPRLLHYVARDFMAPQEEGVVRIGIETADGRIKGVSNPVWVERHPVRRVYYGELHQHTYLHDGRGVFVELYLYGRRVGLLDFAAITPHHMPMSVTGPAFHMGEQRWPSENENWPELEKATKLMNGWEGLVTFLAYEYSVGTRVGGHHNLYYNADRAKTTMQLDPNHPMAPISRMLEIAQRAKVPVLAIAHIGARLDPPAGAPRRALVRGRLGARCIRGILAETPAGRLAARCDWRRRYAHELLDGQCLPGSHLHHDERPGRRLCFRQRPERRLERPVPAPHLRRHRPPANPARLRGEWGADGRGDFLGAQQRSAHYGSGFRHGAYRPGGPAEKLPR